MDEKLIEEALYATISKSILDSLDTDARDAILQKSISDSITSWEFRREINNVVADKAKQTVKELVESEEWESRITEAIKDGFGDYLVSLRAAIPGVISLCLHGKEGQGYEEKSGSILRCWPRK